MLEAKLKHLEFIQGIINRMAANSFSLKTWAVTIVSAIIVLATKDGYPRAIPVAWVPIVLFWFLDAYFLRMERIYRGIYAVVADKTEAEIDFELSPAGYDVKVKSYAATMLSITLGTFYGGLFVAVLALYCVCRSCR